MKFFLSILATGLLICLGGIFFPWWWLAIAAALIAWIIVQHPFKSFLAGFLGAGLLWLILAWLADLTNSGILSARIAAVFQLKNPFMMVSLTGLIGAIVGGLSALSASMLRHRLRNRRAA